MPRMEKQNKNKLAAVFERLVLVGPLDHILPDIFDLLRRILASPGNHPVVLQETIVTDLLPEFRISKGRRMPNIRIEAASNGGVPVAHTATVAIVA